MNNVLEKIKRDLSKIVIEVLDQGHFSSGDLFVLGCSTSEIQGQAIGKDSNLEIGKAVIETIYPILNSRGVFLAVQGCEHINRALVIEKKVNDHFCFEEVTVVPQIHAGGACSVAAFHQFKSPVMVEKIICKGGLDIGDTCIGMHVKHVQIPIRTTLKQIGQAHISALTSRPKLIGGIRARYE